MWIIPKNLPTYHSVLATKGLVEDCEEFSRMSERSLTAKSKFTQWRTWSQRWKRVTYIQRLSTQTLKPSHIKNFVAEWTSYQRDSLASHSAPLVAEAPQKILDTFTPLSQEESQSADQLMLFSKMSKGLSQAKQPMGSRYSSMSSEIWKKEVTRLRGEYSLRLKLALHTSGRECLSWPTAKLSDGEGGRINTILTEGGFKSLRKKSNQYFGAKLRDAVETYEEKNWPTPTLAESSGGKRTKQIKEGKWHNIQLREAIDLENEKNWATPNTLDHLPPKEGEAMQRLYDTHRKGRTSPSNLREQVNPKSWPTPTTAEAEKISNKANYGQKGLSNHPSIVGEPTRKKGKKDRKGEKSWPTPKARDWKGGMGTSKARQKRDLDKIVHLPNTQQDREKSSTSGKSQGRLNPNWVEQLMGLPVGWTQLPTEWID